MLNLTTIPASRVPVVEQDADTMTREWYRFFVYLLSKEITVSATAPSNPQVNALWYDIS
jgi:hypothetical protein